MSNDRTYVYKGGPRNGKARTITHSDKALAFHARHRPGPQGCHDEYKAAGMEPGIYVYLETNEQGHYVMIWREVRSFKKTKRPSSNPGPKLPQ